MSDLLPTSDPSWLMFDMPDPFRLRYFDEDSQARDETNWECIVGGLSDDDECELSFDPASMPGEGSFRRMDTYLIDGGDWFVSRPDGTYVRSVDARASGRCFLPFDVPGQHCDAPYLFVRVDSPAFEWVQSCADRLSDYPLLDESAYSEREYAAWEQSWDEWARADVCDAVADVLGVDRDVVSDVLAAVPDWEYVAQCGMSYNYGFSGEYDHNGAVAAVVAMIGALSDYLSNLFTTARTLGAYAAGVRSLPFPTPTEA